MKAMKILVTSILSLMLVLAKAQPFSSGDKLRDVQLQQLYNYKKHTAQLSEFTGKPLIIHFWFSRCGTCIKAFNKLLKLQEQFKGKLQVLLVTADPPSLVQEFYERVPAAKASIYPVVVADTLLGNWFPHTTEPHEVWVNKDGIVTNITEGTALDSANVASFLSGIKINAKEKTVATDMRKFKAMDPIVSDYYKEQPQALMQYSMLSSYIDGVSAFISAPAKTNNGTIRVAITNSPLYSLYRLAHNKQELHPAQVLLPDSLKFFDVPARKGLYCYDAHLKFDDVNAAFRKMHRDLDLNFGWKSHVTRRIIPVLVLVRTGTDDKLTTKETGKRAISFFTDTSREYRNLLMTGLLNQLNQLPLKVIDETGCSQRIDISLPLELTNIETTRHYLRKVGLDLVQEEREIEVIIFE